MNKKIVLLIAISMLGPMTLNMFLPALPIMRTDFDLSESVAQLFITLGMLFFSIGTSIYGFISDRIGRKSTMLIGLTLYITGNVICTFSLNTTFFMIGRCITTFGGAAVATSIRTSISDIYGLKKASKVYAWIAVTMVFVPLVAPTLGGYITEIFSWHWIFLMMSIFGFLAFVSTMLYINETLNTKSVTKEIRSGLLQDIKLVLYSRQWWIYSLLCGIITSVSFAFTSGMPYIGSDIFGLTPAQYGTWLILGAIGYFLGSIISAKISERKSVSFMTTTGTVISFVFSAILMASYYFNFMTLLNIFIFMSLINFGSGLAVPSAMAASINIKNVPKGATASMQGLLHTAIPISGVQLVAIVYDKTVAPLFTIILTFTLLSLIIALIGRKLRL